MGLSTKHMGMFEVIVGLSYVAFLWGSQSLNEVVPLRLWVSPFFFVIYPS